MEEDKHENKENLTEIVKILDRLERDTMNTLYDDFVEDRRLVEACGFNLLKICKILEKLNTEEKSQLEGIDLAEFAKLPEKLLETDMQSLNDLTWGMVTEGLPLLREKLEDKDD